MQIDFILRASILTSEARLAVTDVVVEVVLTGAAMLTGVGQTVVDLTLTAVASETFLTLTLESTHRRHNIR